MWSLLRLAAANLGRKRLETALTALIILASALLLCTALGIIGSTQDPVRRMYERLRASHLVLEFDTHSLDAERAEAWWAAREEVASIRLFPTYQLRESLLSFQGREIPVSLALVERPPEPVMQDLLLFVEGREAACPAAGEVWIPTSISRAGGMRIRAGDTIRIPTESGGAEVTVSAVVVDPQYSPTAFEPSRIWVAPGELARLFPLSGLSEVTLGIRLASPAALGRLWKAFQESLPVPYPGMGISYSAVYAAATANQRLMGSILLTFAAVTATVVLAIVYSTISASILSEYRTIGILKAQGFSTPGLLVAHALQYQAVCLASIPVGVALALPVLRPLTRGLAAALGAGSLRISLLVPGLLTFLALSVLVQLASLLGSIRIGRIAPAAAIRFGAPLRAATGLGGVGLRRLKALPVPLSLGISHLVSDRRQFALLFLSLGLTVFVLGFCANFVDTIRNLGAYAAYWGEEDCSVRLVRARGRSSLGHAQLMQRLAADPRVRAVVPGDSFAVLATVPASGARAAVTIVGDVYDGNLEAIGLVNLRGRNPEADNEVSLAAPAAQLVGRDVGDAIDMVIEGQRFTYLVTGIYQSTHNNGRSFRLLTPAVLAANALFEPADYFVNLAPDADPRAFADDWQKRSGGSLRAEVTADRLRRQAEGTTAALAGIIALIGGVSAFVCALIVFNATLLRIHEQRSELGTWKSLGMTSGELILAGVWRIACVAVAGAAVGIPVAALITPRILAAVLASRGIVRFPSHVSVLGTLGAIAAGLSLAALSGWAASRRITRIHPRELMSS